MTAITRTPRANAAIVERDVAKLEHITVEETQNLRVAGINSVEELWTRIGEDLSKGVEDIAAQTGIDQARLMNALIAEAASEVRRRRGSGFERYWFSLKRHLLDVVLIAGLIILIILALRAGGVLANLRSPLGLHDFVLVAARDLNSGRVLRSGDLRSARLDSHDDYFNSGDQIEGLVLAQRIPRSKPLRYGDVLRFQVVAATDISSGTIIEKSSIKMEWSPYEPSALIQLDKAVGSKTRQAIRSGGVILSEFISPDTESTIIK
jgi:SAF domain